MNFLIGKCVSIDFFQEVMFVKFSKSPKRKVLNFRVHKTSGGCQIFCVNEFSVSPGINILPLKMIAI